MVIQHNLSAMNANRSNRKNNGKLAKSLEKLSSGYAINRAGDNAAGLAVSEKMRSQIHGIKQSVQNCADGISLVQTFEGALGETVAIIKRMKTLADQSANGNYDNSIDRKAIQVEYMQLCDEVNHIAETDFNGVVMLNGGVDPAQTAKLESAINSAVADMAVSVSSSKAAAADYASETAAYSAKAGATVCGAFSVYGKSSDFSFDSASGVLTITGGDVTVEGTGAVTSNTIVVAKDKSAHVTLKNVNIKSKSGAAFKMADDSTGNVKLTLEGDNKLVCGGGVGSGLQKNGVTGSLTIDGSGSLFTRGSSNEAALGSVGGKDTGNITINSGVITAHAVLDAGIGSGIGGSAYDITINGGYIVAIGGKDGGAGIGGGKNGKTGNITINGGTVVATSESNGAGIGGGQNADGTNISFNGHDTIVIVGGKNGAQDIGGGAGGGTSNVTINEKDGLIKESFSGSALGVDIKDGVIIHADGNMPPPDIPGEDNPPPEDEKEIPAGIPVTKRPAFTKGEAKLTYTDSFVLQTGARSKDAVKFTFAYESNGIGCLENNLDCTSAGLGLDGLTLGVQDSANYAVDKLDHALNKVSLIRSTFGAAQNRLEHKIDNLNNTNENLTAAESRIRDTDMAAEMMNFTKNQILSSASQSMLAQANSLPQGVLSLIGQ